MSETAATKRGRSGIFSLVILAVTVLAIMVPAMATFWTDWLWFDEIKFSNVFWGIIRARVEIGLIAALVAFVVVAVNVFAAKRFSPDIGQAPVQSFELGRLITIIESAWKWVVPAACAIFAIISAIGAQPYWSTYIQFKNGVPFNRPDPEFGLDVGWFVYTLPLVHALLSLLFSVLFVAIIGTAFTYFVFGGIRPVQGERSITRNANAHLSILLAILVAVQGVHFWVMRYDLSYSPRGSVTGLSYTDVHAELRAYTMLAVVCALVVVALFYSAARGGWILPISAMGVLVVGTVLLGGVYPEAIQRFTVDPQELPREREYIKRNLEMTRWAYQIDDEHVTYEQFGAKHDLTAAQVNDNATTLNSIRLWDPATLRNTYKQLQELRPYYDFRGVDVGRYLIDGSMQQVTLSVREIETSALNEPTWQNLTTLYTHGYGLVASTVSTAASDGQPEFLSRDIPNRGVPAFELSQPRIYYGERSPEYSIVGTTGDEFDFETDAAQEHNRYDGAGGVLVGSLLRRIAFALRFGEPNILLSNLIDSDSKIMYNRDIRSRVQQAAPFLQTDGDPYPAVVDGRVMWIVDAYTVTDLIPYSERIDLTTVTRSREKVAVPVVDERGQATTTERISDVEYLHGRGNYVRNSVKAVVDAYDGTVTLYRMNDKDPLADTWDKAFPGMFTPVDQASDALKGQFRHPEGMFRAQSHMLTRYHIQDTDAFYNASDRWQLPKDQAFGANNKNEQGSDRPFPPSYQLIRLPGEKEENFSLIQPFNPHDRDVLASYMAASGSFESLGKLRVLTMPPTSTVFGPSQVFARINQDSEVSQLITLLNDTQSQIIYGNLIVVPVEESLLYAMPLFLKSNRSEIPELRRVVLVYGDRVVMEDRLDTALKTIFGDLPDIIDTPESQQDEDLPSNAPRPAGETPLSSDQLELLGQAIDASIKADEALKSGDLAGYQEGNTRANEALRRLGELTGAKPPTQAAPATPAPGPEGTQPTPQPEPSGS
ncbi:UPF0182 family protein [Stomatohabitans albus]|uniref:UPF0182 family membrane protein n=1 Tax=Stomatohabitans albus TaxID=3110766 RepID=UPI00300CA9FC